MPRAAVISRLALVAIDRDTVSRSGARIELHFGGSSRETVLVRTADTKPLHFLPLLSLARGANQ